MMREETRGMKAFFGFLQNHSDAIEGIDEEDIDKLDDVHDEFSKE